ncbi:MAG: hypothetical protein J6T47_03630 [Lachnospiraceae bacterium]|nr:hypothetical protein [Lachnospiraceae bacterium]
MSIPKAEKPDNKNAEANYVRKDGKFLPKVKVKNPWSLKKKMIFWPLSAIISCILTIFYTFLVIHICYTTVGTGTYLIDNKFVILAASVGLFAVLFILEWLIRGGNRRLRVEEFCASVYLVPAIVYGVIAWINYDKMKSNQLNMIDAMDNDYALFHYYFLLMFYYTLIALLFRGFFNFLGLMREYSKAKRAANSKRK